MVCTRKTLHCNFTPVVTLICKAGTNSVPQVIPDTLLNKSIHYLTMAISKQILPGLQIILVFSHEYYDILFIILYGIV